jgi:hypothetical protein
MQNVVFRDISTQFVPHERHITSPIQNPAGFHDSGYGEYRLLGYHSVRAALVRTYVSEEFIATIIWVKIVSNIVAGKC